MGMSPNSEIEWYGYTNDRLERNTMSRYRAHVPFLPMAGHVHPSVLSCSGRAMIQTTIREPSVL